MFWEVTLDFLRDPRPLAQRHRRLKPLFALLFACLLILASFGETALAVGPPMPASVSSPKPDLTYARVTADYLSTYSLPWDAEAGLPPSRVFEPGFVWVSLADDPPLSYDGEDWYLTSQNDYVSADEIAVYNPSKFQGAAFATPPDKPFGWIVSSTAVSSTPGGPATKGAPWLPRYSLVTLFDQKKVGGWTWYRVGDGQWVEQRKLGIVTPSQRPPAVPATDKWIEVNLYEQTLAAYEGDRLVYATLVSSGLPQWSTPRGLFQVWAKVTADKMSGADGRPDYYWLDDVPWILYFNAGVALHGAYWHDGFGFPHSHGCVNLAPKDALWLYDWATPASGPGVWTLSTPENPGTWVWVH